jgi:glyoxylase-like metal-dependent hydrolase (beta-lactamase superfamily II)
MRTLLSSDALVLLARAEGPFAMNQHMLVHPPTGDALLVDAGGPVQDWLDAAARLGARIQGLWQTHAHIDHVLGVPDTRRALPGLPIWLHPDETTAWDGVRWQARLFGLPDPGELPAPDHALHEGMLLPLGPLTFEVLVTPGHSPGHCVFYCREVDVLIGGDLLFEGSIGRTDLPGSDPAAMTASLRRIMGLPDTVRVFPGHMGATTIGRERAHNPFVRQATGR